MLKALDAVAEAEAEFGNSPRSIALAFDRFLAGKEAPGALNEEGDGAVRIMTVHASKGLEYPVVAVAECFGVRKSSGAAQMGRVEGGAQVVALPARYDGVKLSDGTFVKGDDVKKQFEHAFKGKGTSLWLPPELMEDVCATGSPAEAFARLRNDDLQLSLEERARLLYVAMTRARELVILAMDAGVSRGKVTAPTFDVETDLTYDVLRRILPTDALDMPQLDADRLVFDNSQPGDYELISLSDFTFGEQAFEANASLDAEAGSFVAIPMSPIMLRTQPCPVLPTPCPIRLNSYIPRRRACAWARVRSRRVIRTAIRRSPRRSMPRRKTVPPRRVFPWTRRATMPSRMARRWPMQTWLLSSPPATPWRWARRSMPPASGSSRWVPMRCPLSVPMR